MRNKFKAYGACPNKNCRSEYTHVAAEAVLGSEDEARKLADSFPKSLRVKCHPNDSKGNWRVLIDVNLTSRDGNPINETGLKRWKRFLKDADIEWELRGCRNDMTSVDHERILNS